MDDALNTYKMRTKMDLREHPLAAQLQTCESPAAILAILQGQFQGLDQSRGTEERWTKRLDPVVTVFHAFSNTIGASVSTVCLGKCTSLRSVLIFM